MFLSPYKTTPCKDYKLDPILSEIMLEKVNGNLMDHGHGIWLITPRSTQISLFTQPITRLELNRPDGPEVVIDARALLRENRGGLNDWVITNSAELDFQVLRAQLQTLWMSDGFDRLDLIRVGDLPSITFINWISKSLSSKLGLDPQQYIETTIVAGYYYACLFYDEQMFSEDIKMKIATLLARWTRVQVPTILGVVDKIGYIRNIREFVDALKQCVQSPRMEQLNIGLVYALLGGSWFGPNSRESVAVALEHPPTFVAFVYAAVNLRSYRNAVLSKVVLLATRGGNDKEFAKNLNFLITSP